MKKKVYLINRSFLQDCVKDSLNEIQLIKNYAYPKNNWKNSPHANKLIGIELGKLEVFKAILAGQLDAICDKDDCDEELIYKNNHKCENKVKQ